MRHCILHASNRNEYITEKPIDCVFFTCTNPMKCKEMTKKISLQWREALSLSFSGSEKRFKELLNLDSEKESKKSKNV